jgi:hypothetical protein
MPPVVELPLSLARSRCSGDCFGSVVSCEMFPAPPSPPPSPLRAAPGRVLLVTLVVPLSAHAPALQMRCARGIPFALLMFDSQRRCGKRAPSTVVALRRQFRTLFLNRSIALVGSVCFRRRGQGHQKPGFPRTQPRSRFRIVVSSRRFKIFNNGGRALRTAFPPPCSFGISRSFLVRRSPLFRTLSGISSKSNLSLTASGGGGEKKARPRGRNSAGARRGARGGRAPPQHRRPRKPNTKSRGG